MTFEEQFKQLEEILSKLERGDLSLDESLREYEHGVKALRGCHQLLGAAEKRIEELDLAPAGAPKE
jgi:exodeoxyribonuclease VII small subunit